MNRPKLKKWTPTTDLRTLRRMGKLGEELGELQAVVARVIIQGMDEVDPSSGKVNRQRLMEELADVSAQIGCTVQAFDLDLDGITRRAEEKIGQMAEWDAFFLPSTEGSAPAPRAHQWSEEEATEAAHAAGFAGTHWFFGPHELVHLLNMLAARPLAGQAGPGERG